MAARKKKVNRKKQAVRDHQQSGIPGWLWLLIGMVMGLGLAVFLGLAGYSPSQQRDDKPKPNPQASRPSNSDSIELEAEPSKPRYDFYTVLPEMEVVIPEQEIQQRVNQRDQAMTEKGPYLIQIGSFKDYQDADRMKAQLAFLGFIAEVKQVSINEQNWHRVRIGPYTSLREINDVKRQLQDNQYDAIVLSVKN